MIYIFFLLEEKQMQTFDGIKLISHDINFDG